MHENKGPKLYKSNINIDKKKQKTKSISALNQKHEREMLLGRDFIPSLLLVSG